MQSNKMEDRGDGAMKTHLTGCDKLVMKQTRRGWLQECLGCEVRIASHRINRNLRWCVLILLGRR
jgi:hypothetical protein